MNLLLNGTESTLERVRTLLAAIEAMVGMLRGERPQGRAHPTLTARADYPRAGCGCRPQALTAASPHRA